MYLLGSFSRSKSTTHCTTTAIASVMTLACPPPSSHHSPRLDQTFQLPRAQKKPPCRNARSHHTASTRPLCPTPVPRSVPTSVPRPIEDIFLQSLACASLCRRHARPHSTHSRPSLPPVNVHPKRLSLQNSSLQHSSERDSPQHSSERDSPQSSTERDTPNSSTDNANPHDTPAIPQEVLRNLVDVYEFTSDTHPTPRPSDIRTPLPVPVQDLPAPRNHHHNRPRPASHPKREKPPDVDDQMLHIRNLSLLLKNPLTPHDTLFDAYQALPHPRISYLSDHYIGKLMRHFAVVEFRDEQSMLRYLSLVDDLAAANIPLTASEWNSAITFAGRWARHTTDLHVETATQIWLRMQQDAVVDSDHITFNILFDIAAKAGKFVLAEVIMNEMMTRQLPENRMFRTNKIFYYGMKRDGDAVRQAYKELVDAGELVDTVVLNCVIASLIKAGEASAAEHIFLRMKAMHAESTHSKHAPRGWRQQRDLGRVLDRAARSLRKDPEQRSKVQEATPISPTIHTYRLLIKYHAHESGNIDRVTELLDDMHDASIRMHGSIFYQLFRGFQMHGGVRYSSWTKSRLTKLWSVFQEFVKRTDDYNKTHPPVLDEEDRGCYYDTGVVIAVLQAYNKVVGKDSAMEIWDEIMDKWNPDAKALNAVNGALANMFDWRGD